MATASSNGEIIAESDDFQHVEGNVYFPIETVKMEYFTESADTQQTYCHWKGIASYYDVTVNGETNKGGAWFYAEPYPQAASIKDHVAFWNGIEVSGAPEGNGLVEGEPSLDGKTGWEALCWLIKFSEEDVIAEATIEEITGIKPVELSDIWQVLDVQRYASRYKRDLIGGQSSPYLIIRT